MNPRTLLKSVICLSAALGLLCIVAGKFVKAYGIEHHNHDLVKAGAEFPVLAVLIFGVGIFCALPFLIGERQPTELDSE